MLASDAGKILSAVPDSPPVELWMRYSDSMGVENTVPVQRIVREDELGTDTGNATKRIIVTG
jgi:hypothetical protein